MAGLNRSRGLDFLLSGNKIKEQAETEVKAATTVQESSTTILPVNDNSVVLLPIEKLKASVYQPRKAFNEESLNELASSIKEHGLLEPLLVKKSQDEMYEIICGERRFRACKIAQLASVPCLIRDDLELNGYAVALIENIQREDLNPVEMANAFSLMLNECNLTQEELAKTLGKSRSSVTNILRINNLHDEIKNMIVEGLIDLGHAKVILSLEDKELQLKAAQYVVKNSLTVRQTEKLVSDIKENGLEDNTTKSKKSYKNPSFNECEKNIGNVLSGVKVKFNASNEDKGKITLSYTSKDQLEHFLALFSLKE